jgi:hypothetical protein
MSVRSQSWELLLLSDLMGNAELRGEKRKAIRAYLLYEDPLLRPVPAEQRSQTQSIWTNDRKKYHTTLNSFSRIIQCGQVMRENRSIQCDQVIRAALSAAKNMDE